MADTAEKVKKNNKHVIADFICPTKEARKLSWNYFDMGCFY